jgi:hypothetical protein
MKKNLTLRSKELRGQFEAIALKIIPVKRSDSTVPHFRVDIPRFPCTVIVCGPDACSDDVLSINHPSRSHEFS